MMIRLPGHFPFKIPRQISGYRFSAGHVFLVMAAFFAGMMLVTPVSAVSLAFSGTVYEGYTPDTSHPLNGVQVQVYGSNNFNSYPPAAKPMGTGRTNTSGHFWVNVTAPNNPEFSILVLIPPAGSVIVAATPVHGTRLPNGSVSFRLPYPSGTGADFWVIPSVPPAAGFFFVPKGQYRAPVTLNFTDTSANYPDSWSWDFGDGTHSVRKNPSHTFTAPGEYTVTLTVSNAFGRNTTRRTLIVSPPLVAPIADFSATPADGRAPLLVRFTDLSTGNPVHYAWDFDNDGITDSFSRNPEYTYTREGMYSVSLTVQGQSGIEDSVLKRGLVSVSGIPVSVQTTIPETRPVPTVTSPPLCTLFSIPCEWAGAILIIAAVIIVLGFIRQGAGGRDTGTGTEPPKKTREYGAKKQPEPSPFLDVRGGVGVTGMDSADCTIQVEVKGGIECPE